MCSMKKKAVKRADRRNTRRRKKDGLLADRNRASGKRHPNYFRNAAILLLLLIMVILSYAGYHFVPNAWGYLFTENDFYQIRHIDMSSDGNLRPEDIHEYVPYVRTGTNLLAEDINKIRDDLMSVSIVESVDVRRVLPDTLQIRISERVPLARVRHVSTGILFAVDRNGNVLGPSIRSPSLPTITGLRHPGLRPNTRVSDPLFTDALDALDFCDRTALSEHFKIKSIEISDREILTLWLQTGEQVFIERDYMQAQLNSVALTLRNARHEGRYIREIDARGGVIAIR